MSYFRLTVVLLFILQVFSLSAQLTPRQEKQKDSLEHIIATTDNDTILLNAYQYLDYIIVYIDPEQSDRNSRLIDSIATAHLMYERQEDLVKFYKKKKAFAQNNIGTSYYFEGDYETTLKHWTLSLRLFEQVGDRDGEASALSNIGLLHDLQENYEVALDYYSRSLEIMQELGKTDDRYLVKAAGILSNIGLVNGLKGDTTTALDYYVQSLKLRDEIGDIAGKGRTYNNMGNMLHALGDEDSALVLFELALELSESVGDPYTMAQSLHAIATTYIKQGSPSKALPFNQRALEIATEVGMANQIQANAKNLYEIYKYMGKYQQALEMHELYVEKKEQLESEENAKAVMRQEFQYEYEKQAAADSILALEEKKVHDAQLAAEKAENSRRKQQSYYLLGGLGVVILFSIFIFNRFRVTRRQKVIIEEQKKDVDRAYGELEVQKDKVEIAYEQLEEKNQEILDSINYAKRIQSAILPPTKLVKEYLKNSFVLYKPKDIVAGDFYWMEHRENKVIFAAADCTGHGVPGAMVSVVCNNGLNRSVREHGLTDPGKILDKTREIVISEFEKSEEEVKDGMDVALCSLEGKVLSYAGAHNPLWIIKNGAEEIEEIKADKQPIGKFGDAKPFTTHTLELETGDTIYIFSDGFADQFGGDKGKKFKASNFKKLLLAVKGEAMEKQRELIDEEFEKWRGTLEQLDDVCVIGVRV